MRIAFSFASVPELQKNAFVNRPGAIETNFPAARAYFGINQVRIKEQLLRLLFDGRRDMRMAVPGAGDCVSAIKVEVSIAVARIDPDTLTALGNDRHFLVSRELKLIFQSGDSFKIQSREHLSVCDAHLPAHRSHRR